MLIVVVMGSLLGLAHSWKAADPVELEKVKQEQGAGLLEQKPDPVFDQWMADQETARLGKEAWDKWLEAQAPWVKETNAVSEEAMAEAEPLARLAMNKEGVVGLMELANKAAQVQRGFYLGPFLKRDRDWDLNAFLPAKTPGWPPHRQPK